MINKVAVILPIYKNDNDLYVSLAIQSILSQTYQDIHLFIGVDGPIGHDLLKCLRTFETKGNVAIEYFSKNRGLAVVLNDLLDRCISLGYNYIARMDADDISLPQRLEKQMIFLESHPHIDIVGGSIEEINEKGESRGKVIVYPETPEACYAFFARRNPHAHPAVLFRSSFFEKSGCYYRPEYRQNQDTMLWFDGLKKGVKMANIPDVVLQFRMTENLFKKRRNGWKFAKKQLKDRMMINRELKYGISAYLFSYAMFIMLISPAWIKKIAYKVFR